MQDDIEWLSHNPLIELTARIARTFRIDPVSVLRDQGDEFLLNVRAAALSVVQRDEKQQSDQIKRGSSRGKRGR